MICCATTRWRSSSTPERHPRRPREQLRSLPHPSTRIPRWLARAGARVLGVDSGAGEALEVADRPDLEAPQVHIGETGVREGQAAHVAVHECHPRRGRPAEVELVDRAVLEQHVLEGGRAQVDPVELAADAAGGADLGVVDVQRPDTRAAQLDVTPGGAGRVEHRGVEPFDAGLDEARVLEDRGVRGDAHQLALGERGTGEIAAGEVGAHEAEPLVMLLGRELRGVGVLERREHQAFEHGRTGGGASAHEDLGVRRWRARPEPTGRGGPPAGRPPPPPPRGPPPPPPPRPRAPAPPPGRRRRR